MLSIELAKKDIKNNPSGYKTITHFCDLISYYEMKLENNKMDIIKYVIENNKNNNEILDDIEKIIKYNSEEKTIYNYESYLLESLKLAIINFMDKKENSYLLNKPLINIYAAICEDCDVINSIIADSNEDTNLYGNIELLKKSLISGYDDAAMDFILKQNDFFYHINICEYLIYNKLLFKAIADVIY